MAAALERMRRAVREERYRLTAHANEEMSEGTGYRGQEN